MKLKQIEMSRNNKRGKHFFVVDDWRLKDDVLLVSFSMNIFILFYFI